MNLPIREANPYFHWVLAKTYYDGAMTGIGLHAPQGVVKFFCVVGWDEQHWQRIFTVTKLRTAIGDRLIHELQKLEPRQLPFWCPGPQSSTPDVESAWNAIHRAAMQTTAWQLVEGHDLLVDSGETATVSATEGQAITDLVRSESLLVVTGSELLKDFLRQIRGM